MATEQLSFEVITERPVVRNDQTSEIDVVIDLITSRSVETEKTSYAINLCLVIDRSGSMAGDKLEQAKKSCIDIYESLNPNDKFTVLAFDSDVIVVVNPQTPKDDVKKRISDLTSGGATNLSKGWYLGLLELQTYTTDEHINRLILLSDGQANEGEQKPSVLGAESGQACEELGITTSTIGIGTAFQEDILAALARESGGRFWFIGEARIEDIIKEEFSGALSIRFERPRIEVSLPQGVTIVRELNELSKTSNRYRIRPVKANDRFCFAFRLRVEPTLVNEDKLLISATLFDGADEVERNETSLHLAPVEEYVQSPEDSRVATIVRSYMIAASDEQMAQQMDTGNVTTMIEMLQTQSALMRELSAKLAGEAAIPWETAQSREAERQRWEAERQHWYREEEMAEVDMLMAENEVTLVITQLIDLLQGLGREDQAHDLILYLQKDYRHRGSRKQQWFGRGDADDRIVKTLLRNSLHITEQLIADYPDLQEELVNIRERINEHLAHFS